jgi:putative PIN family toxin of toxin-antitoxin system
VIRAVIDTNVLVSGLLTPNGNEALIILAIHQGFLHPCCSDEILAEYTAVLARPKFAFAPDEIAALLAMLREKGAQIRPSGPAPALPDVDDGKFLHCAEASQAEYIVTGNKRHFPQELCGAIRVVNAGELLDRITLEIRP